LWGPGSMLAIAPLSGNWFLLTHTPQQQSLSVVPHAYHL